MRRERRRDDGRGGDGFRMRSFFGALRERILPLLGRAEVRNRWLRQRLETVLPTLTVQEEIPRRPCAALI